MTGKKNLPRYASISSLIIDTGKLAKREEFFSGCVVYVFVLLEDFFPTIHVIDKTSLPLVSMPVNNYTCNPDVPLESLTMGDLSKIDLIPCSQSVGPQSTLQEFEISRELTCSVTCASRGLVPA